MMKKFWSKAAVLWMAILPIQHTHTIQAQYVGVGSGSYTTQFPGMDAAGRNAFPSGVPYTTGKAATKPAPTNDWWSKKIKEAHADNLFSYPFTLKTINEGLVVTYIPWGVFDNFTPVRVGVAGLNATAANVADFSDWTVTLDWTNGVHSFQATAGIGMPFIYFTKDSADVASITVTQGQVAVTNELLLVTDVHYGADFAVYAPAGSVWTQNGNTYTSTLNGKNYWSLAFLPPASVSPSVLANQYRKYAFVFPIDTRVTWEYEGNTSVLRTDFFVQTEIMEGSDTTTLMGLLPHQWSNLPQYSPVLGQYSYPTVRGELKTLDGNAFSVENVFSGILPTLPYLDFLNPGFSPHKLKTKIQLIENDGLPEWTDSYNEGQLMNRLIQTARLADLSKDTTALNKIIATIKLRLEDWLKAEPGEVAFLFYYHQPWNALLGYPAGHGQDANINDHHFHWGYFIHAAAFLEQFEPGWADQWGEMVNYLVRDAANPGRNDSLFPFLRNFSPYAGHCWANGFATFPQGNDQESTSESMQFNSSLIHWGSVTGNDSIRDLGIYLYTTEQSAIEEYWFDMYDRVFLSSQGYGLVSRVWGNSYDNGTFWTSDIAASYGIEMYPIHGGSLYLGRDTAYVSRIWSEIEQHTGILANQANPNLWHDVFWEYLAFIDPDKAISLYDSYPDRALKFGISDAQTYHWLHAMGTLGRVEAGITANHPVAAAFDNDSIITYVGHNYSDSALSILFSDGYILQVPAGSMATSRDISIKGTLVSSFPAAYPGGSVQLSLTVAGGTPVKVEFLDGETLIGQVLQPPYLMQATGLVAGRHTFYARIYEGNNFGISNLVSVTVGEQLAYTGALAPIPGTLEAGLYDVYEGGIGQGIAYNDVDAGNQGNFRPEEYVDASLDLAEGAVVGWIASGEWLEFTVDVQQPGNYRIDLRYACGNQGGGGPFGIFSDDVLAKDGISVAYTGGWTNWATKTINDVPLKSGRQVLRLYFEQGELNLGRLVFTYVSPLQYDQPIAVAGSNILVQLPVDTCVLDASNSSDPGNAALSFLWSQVYGPSVLAFSDAGAVQPTVYGLTEGVYLIRLVVDNGQYTDSDELYVISSPDTNIAPNVSILSPGNGTEFIAGESVLVTAFASDLFGSLEQVDFFANTLPIGSAFQYPYQTSWSPSAGQYSLTAVATDNDGASRVSAEVIVTILQAPPCFDISGNGEFHYEFSPDDNNPTLTFIPSLPGMGIPTCILYYGTDPGNMPGYYVTPDVPFQLNASKGTLIYFYYTYSYPGQGEHNNSANKDSYVIGTCQPPASITETGRSGISAYPNPVTDHLTLTLPEGTKDILIYDYSGRLMDTYQSRERIHRFDMSGYPPGMYVIRVISGDSVFGIKVLR